MAISCGLHLQEEVEQAFKQELSHQHQVLSLRMLGLCKVRTFCSHRLWSQLRDSQQANVLPCEEAVK